MSYRIFLVLLSFFVLYITPHQLFGMEPMAAVPANAETVADEIALAEASRQHAAEAGAEWVDTASLIKRAIQAADVEDWQLALALASRAKKQGELALEQAARESIAWRERVIQ